MENFLHQVLSGLATGSLYASIALALVMIYQATHHVNFAQGELAVFTTYIAWTLVQGGFSYWVNAFAITLVASFVIGIVIERTIVRPIENKPILTVVVVFVGMLFILNSVAGWIYGFDLKSFPSPFPSDAWYASRFMSAHELGMIAVTLGMLSLVFAFFRFTRLGLAMRALWGVEPGVEQAGRHPGRLGVGDRHGGWRA